MARKTDSDTVRRLRSSAVILGGMGVLAAALTSCGSEPDKRCVDPKSHDKAQGYRVISPSQCEGKGTSGHPAGQWYYGSGGSGRYAKGGSFSKSAVVERGGFGSGHGSSGG
ncbi:hypothetical protein GCM10010211_74340 [Streptomyces albospinus]|uniref:Lipoprotein n=2 Tax=Streptomyces albospinus TaxID=285515 RepID=A0ABQ2VLP3_9ACTN|nr:hypothetical protein [Streptomyces albospinus]GGU96220.1 hypothetical protein GCM10010211_74340 [Streptomyces albospinus]